MRTFTRASALLAVTLALALALALPAPAAATPPWDTSSILVKFKRPAAGGRALAAAGDGLAGATAAGVRVVRIAPGATVGEKLAQYRARADVAFAEPNYVAHALLAAPTDAAYETQWGLPAIRALAGWALYPGDYGASSGPTIAVLDTGVDSAHEDLDGGRVLEGADCLGGECVADEALDDNGHGTHVAGIAAAEAGDATGVAGVAFSSRVLPVKVLDEAAAGTYAGIANAIVWAVDHGARVVNLSLGGTGYSAALCAAVEYAEIRGALVVAGAGNNATAVPVYPAACPGAVGVAATDFRGAPSPTASYGAPNVFLSAPGVSVLSTALGGGYEARSGSSMATPFVAGAAALLLAQDPSRTPADVRRVLAATAEKLGAAPYRADPYGTCDACTWSPAYGYGRLDLYAALGGSGEPGPDFALLSEASAVKAVAGATARIPVAVGAAHALAHEVELSVGGLPAGARATFAPAAIPAPGSSELRISTGSAPPGSYVLTITGRSAGETRRISVTLVLDPAPSFAVSVSALGRDARTVRYVVDVSSGSGFVSPVALRVRGLPRGTTARFSEPTVLAPGSAILAVRTSAASPPGRYRLVVTGASGTVVRSARATLAIR